MELRKVQLTGGSSITVTLPKAWVDASKIRPGDVVGCAVQPDGSLAIHPHMKAERAIVPYALEADDTTPEQLFRKIIAAYLMGYEALKITSRRALDSEARRAVRDAVRRIVGLEIVEEQPSSITIQDFLDPREFHLERALRRMGMLTQGMQEAAMEALRKPKRENAAVSEDNDDEVDRLYWLINKQFHAILRDAAYAAKAELTASQALNFLLVARLVERTADHSDRIIRETLQVPPNKVPEAILAQVERQGRKAVDLFQQSITTFFKKDVKKANQIIDEAEKFPDAQKRLLREISEIDSELVGHLALIIESIARTAAYASDVSEVAINHKVAAEPTMSAAVAPSALR